MTKGSQMAGRKILLVDDDSDLRGALADQLRLHEDFTVFEQDHGAGGLEFLKTNNVDLAVLDVDMPDMDGRELCKLARRAGVTIPIIMLTGVDTDSDAILGLDAGANDYVTKPFKFGVLLARVRAHLRQNENSEDATFDIGPYFFKPSVKTLEDRSSGEKLRLTEKETAMLKYLYKAEGRPVGKDELLDKVWGYNSGVSTHTLETHVYRLRQKIEPVKGVSTIVITESEGYRLGN